MTLTCDGLGRYVSGKGIKGYVKLQHLKGTEAVTATRIDLQPWYNDLAAVQWHTELAPRHYKQYENAICI